MESLLSRVKFDSFNNYFDASMGKNASEVKDIRIDLMKRAILRLGEDKYRQLLRWWSGTSAIVGGQDYKITLMNTSQTLPGTNTDIYQSYNAHTCFFTFDVGANAVLKYPVYVKLAKEILDLLRASPSADPEEIREAERTFEREVSKHIDEITESLSNEIRNIKMTIA
jgi:hypothetical protein